MDVIIENATLIPMTERGKIVRGGWIRIQGGKIADVSSEGGTRASKRGIESLDAKGMIIMPGFVNTHVHLFQSLLRGTMDNMPASLWLKKIYSTAKVLRAEDCYAGAMLGCLESVKGGTTTLIDHHCLFRDGEIADAILSGFKEIGIRGFLVRSMMDEGEWVAQEAKQSHSEIFNHCDDLLSRHSDDLKKGRVGIMVGPNTPGINCSPELIREVKKFAQGKRIRISTHIAENDDIVAQARRKYGYAGVVEFLHSLNFLGEEVLGAHCVRLNPLEIKIMHETKTKVAHCPITNMIAGDGVAPVAQMMRGGVTVSIGSDSTASNNTQDMFEVTKITSLLQRVHNLDATLLPPWEVLELATINGAKALGMEKEIGTLEPGKRADLIGIDLTSSAHGVTMHSEISQIVHCAQPADVKLVMIDGDIVVEGGRLKRGGEEEVLRKGQAAGESLVKRIEGLN